MLLEESPWGHDFDSSVAGGSQQRPITADDALGASRQGTLEELDVVAIRTGIVRERRRNHEKRMHRDPIEQGAEIDLG